MFFSWYSPSLASPLTTLQCISDPTLTTTLFLPFISGKHRNRRQKWPKTLAIKVSSRPSTSLGCDPSTPKRPALLTRISIWLILSFISYTKFTIVSFNDKSMQYADIVDVGAITYFRETIVYFVFYSEREHSTKFVCGCWQRWVVRAFPMPLLPPVIIIVLLSYCILYILRHPQYKYQKQPTKMQQQSQPNNHASLSNKQQNRVKIQQVGIMGAISKQQIHNNEQKVQIKKQVKQESNESEKVDQSDSCNYDIADRLLQQLQDQYWEVQKATNLLMKGSESQGNGNVEENEEVPEGYQNIGDNYSNNQLNSSDSEDDNQLEPQQTANLQANPQQHEIPNPQTPQYQLIQIPPTPEETYKIPQANLTNTDIEVQKIKNLALEFDIGTPEWATDPTKLEKRIKQLFGNCSPITTKTTNIDGNKRKDGKIGESGFTKPLGN